MTGSQRPIEVLLAEDSAADVRLTREALQSAAVSARLSVTRNGEEALAFLRRQGPYASAPRPDLILLDLNMPKKDGREVLREVKGDPNLRSIPILVFTSSEDPNDISECYRLHANSYVTKPATYRGFKALMETIQDFWMRCAKLPPNDES